jgi:hypothetical protein
MLFVLAPLQINIVCANPQEASQFLQQLRNVGFLTVISVPNYELMGGRLLSVVHILV